MKSINATSNELLRHIPLLAGLDESLLVDLERASFRHRVKKDTHLFFRGDPAEDFYLLLSGEVVILLTNPDGRELIINEMRPGDFFGELGLITGQPRSADAVVRHTAELVVVPRRAFLLAMEKEPRLARRLLEATATRLSRSSEFQDALAFLDAQSRLARVLLELDNLNEDRGYITISQEELAQRAGLIRQTVAKTLGKWRRKGWLLTGRGHIMLLNRDALQLWFKEQAG
ncbi:MAG: Crp/Fnr family transcriptional regulator [Chloroflexota bacterium]